MGRSQACLARSDEPFAVVDRERGYGGLRPGFFDGEQRVVAGRLTQLSRRGLQHVQALALNSTEEVAGRLYAWNRLPASAWRRIDAEPALIAAKAASVAGKNWIQIAAGPPLTHWCVWRPAGGQAAPSGRIWKVYVSPHPGDLAEAICTALSACEGLPVVSLKYGADADGMLRPDKLVVHLSTLEAVQLVASRTLSRLEGCRVHGAPYTAELGGDGLISWGCDPPVGSVAARIAPSWRTWVTRQLAEGLAQRTLSDIEPSEFALNFIERAGVDPKTWAPAPDLWKPAD